jgi:hypothetical protein
MVLPEIRTRIVPRSDEDKVNKSLSFLLNTRRSRVLIPVLNVFQ